MSLFTPELKERIFFYGDKYAQYYDIVEEFTQPHIDFIHDVEIDLLAMSLGSSTSSKAGANILVVGSGTGAEVLRIFRKRSEALVVTVDFSAEMNNLCRRKMIRALGKRKFETQIRMIEEDFFAPHLHEKLAKTTSSTSPQFDAIVAGFLLHHYTLDMKREFYSRIYHLLKPGGVVVHADLFNYESEPLSFFSHHFVEDWMKKQFTSPDRELRQRYGKIKPVARDLLKEWLNHWNSFHIYHPLSSRQRHEGTIFGILGSTGFRKFECPFRYYEVGIIWGQR